jgi:hypothetical protein
MIRGVNHITLAVRDPQRQRRSVCREHQPWRSDPAFGALGQAGHSPGAHRARCAAATAAEQQARFDRFRNDFNDNRPHEALGQVSPTSRYRPSSRPYPNKIEQPWYDADHAVRKVRSNGEIRWGGEMIFLSEALIGEPVGIAETEAGDWLVRFAEIDLGIIERRTKKLRRFTAGRPPRHQETPMPAAQSAPLHRQELR